MRTGEKKQALEYAEVIVKANGTLFIRNLLREKQKHNKKVQIGSSRLATEENLRNAIEGGHLSLAELKKWNESVEGWGKQHVYLYRFPRNMPNLRVWSNCTLIKKRLGSLAKLVGKDTGMRFPEKLTLTSIECDDDRVEFIWHQRETNPLRVPQKNFTKSEGEDEYLYRAFLLQKRRAVMRFVVLPKKKKAALFIQAKLGPAHLVARETANKFLRGKFSIEIEGLPKPDLSKAITKINEEIMNKVDTDHRSRQAKFSSKSSHSTVEFVASKAVSGFNQDRAVRHVGHAVDPGEFKAYSGHFTAAADRDVAFSINDAQARVYFWSRMTRDEVWRALDHILTKAGRG